jgi:hypothetical protein
LARGVERDRVCFFGFFVYIMVFMYDNLVVNY